MTRRMAHPMTRPPSNLRTGPLSVPRPPDRREPMAYRDEPWFEDGSPVGPPSWWEYRDLDPMEALVVLLGIIVAVLAMAVVVP